MMEIILEVLNKRAVVNSTFGVTLTDLNGRIKFEQNCKRGKKKDLLKKFL
jgi:hypothetical protein